MPKIANLDDYRPTAKRGGNNKGTRRGFGNVRKLPSGRFQASYLGPDGARHNGPTTFQTQRDATAWLSMESAAITEQRWRPDTPQVVDLDVPTFETYAADWLERRELKPRTRDEYRKLIGLPKPGTDQPTARRDQRAATTLLATFGALPLDQITPELVDDWHQALDKNKPTQRAHLYALLRTILGAAVGVPGRRGAYLEANPCTIRGAGRSKRVKRIEPAPVALLETIASSLPDRYAALIHLAAWCALRFGELTELRRSDLVLPTAEGEPGLVKIRRGVTWVDGSPVVGPPKTDAGVRDVAIPPHLVPTLREHLSRHSERGRDGLVFPAVGGGHLNHGTFYKHFRTARTAAGQPNLRLHDLRHTGAVMAAQAGATTRELMDRLGHTTVTMAMRYQHVAEGRDAELARKLSKMLMGEQ